VITTGASDVIDRCADLPAARAGVVAASVDEIGAGPSVKESIE